MARRWREQGEVGRGGNPYAPAGGGEAHGEQAPMPAAVILWAGATLYAIFGGADFGAGFWDLVAGDAEKGRRPRARIQRSLTPVWEANHVWLIFILVVLWTAFPEAFGAMMSTLYVPLALAALGIVLRGAGFAFRKSVESLGGAAGAGRRLRPLLAADARSSWAPWSARWPPATCPPSGNGDAFSSWLAPLPLLTGALFVASGAYLAAVFLIADARRGGMRELEEYFPRGALCAAAAAGAFALAGLFALHAEARSVFDGLAAEGLPLVARLRRSAGPRCSDAAAAAGRAACARWRSAPSSR